MALERLHSDLQEIIKNNEGKVCVALLLLLDFVHSCLFGFLNLTQGHTLEKA
jgi:hypothetical protein